MENNTTENKSLRATQKIHPLFIRNTAIVDTELSLSLSENRSQGLPAPVENRKHPSTRRENKIEGGDLLEE